MPTRRTILAAAAAAAGPRPAPAATRTLRFQSIWLNDPEFLGFMIAIDEGLYAAEGLTVEYTPGGPDVIPEATLLAGRADIALTAPLDTARAVARRGARLRIIGAQFQTAPDGIISLASNAIRTPQDLVGRTVACPTVSLETFRAMLRLAGIAEETVTIVPFTSDPTPLARGEIDAMVDYVTETPFTLEQTTGKAAHWFLLADAGLPLYANTITVTENTLRERRPELVAFLRASRAGWARNNADPAIYPAKYATTWFAGTGVTAEATLAHNRVQMPFMQHPRGVLALDEAGIARTRATLARVGIDVPARIFDPSLFDEVAPP